MLREVIVKGERILYEPQTPGHNVHVASRSETGRWHHVDLETGCECDGFKRRRACRHIEAVIALHTELSRDLLSRDLLRQSVGRGAAPAANLLVDTPAVYNAPADGGLVACTKCGRQRAKVNSRGICPSCMTGLDD